VRKANKSPYDEPMTLIAAAILGLVEGLTEFLPVSSTGHLIVVSKLLGLESSNYQHAFDIVIQSGAILAIVAIQRQEIWELCKGLLKLSPLAVRRLGVLLVAFLPAAVLGLAFGSFIKAHLFFPKSVAVALVVGSILIFAIERLKSKPRSSQSSVLDLPFKSALMIGCAQCLGMWPGMSRSLSSMLGGRLVGLSNHDAATFSFWLALPTLLGASLVDSIKYRHELFVPGAFLPLAVAWLVSFATAWVVVSAFLSYLKSHSLWVFAVYRIALAIVIFVLF
jgi:undecaprenyl-diphosphatase